MECYERKCCQRIMLYWRHNHQSMSEDRFKQLDQHPNMKTKLYPKVHHGMDYEGDILKSIDVLKDIIGEIDQI